MIVYNVCVFIHECVYVCVFDVSMFVLVVIIYLVILLSHLEFNYVIASLGKI